MSYRLRSRLAQLNATLLALATLLLTAHFMVERVETAGQRLVSEAMAHIEALATGVAARAPVAGQGELEALLLRAAAYPGLQELRLIGADGQVLAHVRRRAMGPAFALPPGGVLTAPGQAERIVQWQGATRASDRFSWEAERLIVWRSLQAYGTSGHLQLEMSLDPLKQELRQGFAEGVLATLAAALLGAAVIFIWMRRPVRVIRAATDHAGRLFRAPGEKLICPRAGRELDDLVAALNETSVGLQALLDTVAEAVLIVDADDLVVRANRAAEALFARTQQDLVSQPMTALLPDWTPAAVDPADAPRTHSCEVRDRHGRRFPVELSVGGFRHESLPHWIVSLRVVSLRPESEEYRRQAQAAADAASQMTRAFLANISHEIRTPLNAILSMTQLALETALTAQQREYLRAAKESAERVLSRVNDLLDLARLESGELAMQPAAFPLRELFEHTLRRLEPRCRAKGLGLWLEFDARLPERIEADAECLQQILGNLVDNAIKFTQAGGVTVSVDRRHCHEPHCLHVCVEDTGIGIPTERIGALFDPFNRVGASTRQGQEGTGLGLALCSRLVELLGGHIWVESQLGEGSRFHFTLRYTPVGVVPQEIGPAGLRAAASRTSPLLPRPAEPGSAGTPEAHTQEDGAIAPPGPAVSRPG